MENLTLLKFKTNIKCEGCIAKVTPSLNHTAGNGNWNVNTGSPEKVLTVQGQNISGEEILKAIEIAGFKGEQIKE